uniref:Ankyrin-1 n=1 Tax=Cacopsylla melanoneura TaxID=428564 RepID=A0A8D8V4H8_9HEMI
MATVSAQMIDAVSEGNLEKVKDLVNTYGIHCCQAWDYGYVLLQSAICNRFNEIACFLLTKGSKVKNKYSEDQTPLHCAVQNGDVELVQMLLDNGADAAARNRKNDTPLHIAVKQRHAPICKLLSQYGAPLDVLNSQRQLPFFFAITKGWKDIVTALLESGADVNSEDKKWNSVLYTAVTKGDVDIIKEILRFKPAIENESNKKSLTYAIGRFHDDQIVDILLDYGFTLSLGEKTSKILIRNTIVNNHIMAMEHLLLHCGANASSLLHVAAVESTTPDIVKSLLHHGADPNLPDKEGLTPLHKLVTYIARQSITGSWALGVDTVTKHEHNRFEILKLLFEFGADANLETVSDKRTALHLFCEDAFNVGEPYTAQIIDTLVKFGADLHIVDKNGNTPLHIAAGYNLFDVTNVLLKHGADAYAINYEGNTPFQLRSDSAWAILLNHYFNHDDNPATVINLCKMLYSRFSEYQYFYSSDIVQKNNACISLQEYVVMATSLGYSIPNKEVILSKNVDYRETLKEFEISCKQEVDCMKQHIIEGSSLTMYQFLRKRTHALAICLKNEHISSFLAQGDYKEMYPVYDRVIEGHYIRGTQRKRLLDKVDAKCHLLMPSLPQECALTLLGYLNNKDLSVLISVLVPEEKVTPP